MLKTFLKENKISLAKLTEAPKMIPASSKVTKQYYNMDWKQKPMSEPVIAAARSPNHKRRNIFQKITSPASKITAEFPEIQTFSTVQSYEITQEHERQAAKKKLKTNKQNGLCLARAVSKDLKRQISRKSLSNIPESKEVTMPENNDHFNEYTKGQNKRIKRVEQLQAYNKGLKKSIGQNNSNFRQIEDSLIINDVPAQIFTFKSENQSIKGSKSSLSYSNSKFSDVSASSLTWEFKESYPKSPLHFK